MTDRLGALHRELATVVLVDRDREGAEAGLAKVEALLTDSVKAKRMEEIRKQEIMATITATADYGKLKGCDLVVEAVFEDPELKARVTQAAEVAMPADAVFASPTPYLTDYF